MKTLRPARPATAAALIAALWVTVLQWRRGRMSVRALVAVLVLAAAAVPARAATQDVRALDPPVAPPAYSGIRLDRFWTFDGLAWLANDTVHPFGAPTNFWNTPLPLSVLIDAIATPAVAAELAREATVAAPYVNTWQYTAKIVRVPPNQPLVPVLLRGARTDTTFLKLKQALASGMPIPAGWQPTADTDAEGAFYQPDRSSPYDGRAGYYFEGWKFHAEDPATNGGYPWSVAWGGRMVRSDVSVGHYTNWQYSGYHYSTPGDPDSTYQEKGWGTTATSLPLIGGTITEEECHLGDIEHELGLAVIVPHTGTVWPAQRNDGTSSTNPIYEGMRFRLDPTYDPSPLHPFAQIIARAAQKYGIVVWDKAGTLSFRADPACAAYFNGTPGYRVLDGFPWNRLQVIQPGSDATPNPAG